MYKRLFNVPEPVQSVDVSALDLDGDGRLSEKEVMTDKRVDDGLNATRKLMRQNFVMRLQRLNASLLGRICSDGLMQRGIAIPQNLRLQTGGDAGAGSIERNQSSPITHLTLRVRKWFYSCSR